MFSLQTMFGKGDKFFGLLEASAEAARESAAALVAQVGGGAGASLEGFSLARRREKDLAAQISEELVNSFVTALDREDIEALSSVLYKIPKTVEKFAERYALVGERLQGIDFLPRAELLHKATEVVEQMVGQLRGGMRIDRTKKLQDQLQAIESEADRLLLEPYRTLYATATDPMRAILAKDLYELLEKAIDRCRDVGNVVYAIVLKHS
ncbi:MAG TPA: pit accessory protein [Mizugakiibacter sp.]